MSEVTSHNFGQSKTIIHSNFTLHTVHCIRRIICVPVSPSHQRYFREKCELCFRFNLESKSIFHFTITQKVGSRLVPLHTFILNYTFNFQFHVKEWLNKKVSKYKTRSQLIEVLSLSLRDIGSQPLETLSPIHKVGFRFD